jgi:hypothetical protein
MIDFQNSDDYIKCRRHAELVSASPKFDNCTNNKAILKQVQDDGDSY